MFSGVHDQWCSVTELGLPSFQSVDFRSRKAGLVPIACNAGRSAPAGKGEGRSIASRWQLPHWLAAPWIMRRVVLLTRPGSASVA